MPAPISPASTTPIVSRIDMMLRDARERSGALIETTMKVSNGTATSLRSIPGKLNAFSDVLDGLAYTTAKSGTPGGAAVASTLLDVTHDARTLSVQIGASLVDGHAPLSTQQRIVDDLAAFLPKASWLVSHSAAEFVTPGLTDPDFPSPIPRVDPEWRPWNQTTHSTAPAPPSEQPPAGGFIPDDAPPMGEPRIASSGGDHPIPGEEPAPSRPLVDHPIPGEDGPPARPGSRSPVDHPLPGEQPGTPNPGVFDGS